MRTSIGLILKACTGLWLLLAAQTAQAELLAAAQKVLVIHSYHSGLSWTDSIMNGIRDSFAGTGREIEMSAEYLDARRYVDREHTARIQELIISKLKHTKPDLIIVSDNAALEFMLAQREKLFPGTPMVFCGINNFNPSVVAKHRGITGVVEDLSVGETVNLVLRLHPSTKEIIVIGRTSVAADKANRDSFAGALTELPPSLRVTFWDDLPLDELRGKLQNLKEGSVLFINGLITDKEGRQLMYGETTKWICQYSAVPVYSLWDVYLGYGIVGGKLVTGYRQGQLAGGLALRILNGESADRIPVVKAQEANRYMFDYRQILKYRISLSQLPEDAILINRPHSFYDSYKGVIWVTTAVVSALIGFVVLLTIAMVRQHRAEADLSRSRNTLARVLDSVPQSVFWKDRDSIYLGCNQVFARAVGLDSPEQIVGKSDFDLPWPREEAETYRADDREVVERNLAKRHIVEPLQQADGTRLWIDTTKVPLTDTTGYIYGVLGVYEDITERKRAQEDLQRSNELLRAIIDAAPAAIISLDFDGNVQTVWSKWAEKMLGWRADEVMGKPIPSLSADEMKEFQEYQKLVHRGQTLDGIDVHRKRRDGSSIDYSIYASPLYDMQGRISGNIAVLVDITERKQAEKKLREKTDELDRFFTVALDLLCIADTAGVFRRLNPQWEIVLGYPLEELEGKRFLDFIHPDDRAGTEAAVRELAAQETVVNLVNRYRCKDGSYRWIEWRSYPAGEVIYAAARDITESRQMMDTLRETEFFLNRSQQVASIGSYKFNVETGTWIDSPSLDEIFGIDVDYPKTIEGWLTLIAPDDREMMRDHLLRHVIIEHNRFERDYRIVRHNDGQERWVSGLGELEYDDQGNPLRMIGTIQDITDRKRAEEQIRRLNEELEQRVVERTVQFEAANKELEAFTYSVSHDLRAPLRAIDGYTGILDEDYGPNFDEEGRRLCKVIHENTRRMGQLIDDLLAFSRLSRTDMQSAVIDMATMARSLFHELTTPEARERIDFRVDPLPPATGDPVLMRQALMNLLSNAIKFSSKRQRALIEVGAAENNGETVYYVRDNGAGFDMQYVGKLFGVFQRLHSEREFEGTGVGLAIVQRVIRRHGGRVWAEGIVDKGSAFFFTVPGKGG